MNCYDLAWYQISLWTIFCLIILFYIFWGLKAFVQYCIKSVMEETISDIYTQIGQHIEHVKSELYQTNCDVARIGDRFTNHIIEFQHKMRKNERKN